VNREKLQSAVEWYSICTLFDQHRRILWSGQWLEVVSVVQRGYTPAGAFIKIIASNQKFFLLKYSLYSDSWHIVPN
jgi:hypothetical protein